MTDDFLTVYNLGVEALIFASFFILLFQQDIHILLCKKTYNPEVEIVTSSHELSYFD